MASVASSFWYQFHCNKSTKLLNLSTLRIFSPIFIYKHRFHYNAPNNSNRAKVPLPSFSELSLLCLPISSSLSSSAHLEHRWLHTTPADRIKFRKKPSMHNPEEEKQLIKAGYFQSNERNKKNFLMTIDVFKEKEKLLKGHVQFIQTALNHMELFGVHKDNEVYKKLMDVFPKVKMIPENIWQVEFDHYPVQQDCGVDVLHRMEHFGVIPDGEMEDIILTIFGNNSHPMKKYRRMRYWMLKFNNASPWPLPNPVPSELLELAKLAVARMCSVDQSSEVSVFDTREVEDAIDDTWVVSGQSVHQRELLNKQPDNVPLKVEGPFKIFLREQSIDYFVLKADPLTRPEIEVLDKDDVSLLAMLLNPDCSLKPNTALAVRPSVHEQDDGTVLALCVSGTSSRDSLLSWIRLLSRTNQRLEEGLPVIFMQGSPTQSDELVLANQGNQDAKKEIKDGGSSHDSGSGSKSGGNQDTGIGQEFGGSQETGTSQETATETRSVNKEYHSVSDSQSDSGGGQEFDNRDPDNKNAGDSGHQRR